MKSQKIIYSFQGEVASTYPKANDLPCQVVAEPRFSEALRTLTLVVPFQVDVVSVFAVLGCFRSTGIPKFPAERLQVETPSWLAKSPSLQVESPTAPALRPSSYLDVKQRIAAAQVR